MTDARQLPTPSSPTGLGTPQKQLLTELFQDMGTQHKDFWSARITDEEERNHLYAEYSKSTHTRAEIVFYESMSGARVMDNPFSVFKHAVDNTPPAAHKLHVWSCSAGELVPDEMAERNDVVFVKRHSREYMYLLASAKHIIGNSVLPKYFVRKPDQKYMNTWHGIGYKWLGRSHSNPLGASLSVTNMLQATHVISPCSFMTDVLVDRFSIRGSFTGRLGETGYPRIDATLNASEAAKDSLRSRLGTDPQKKTVLYAPTWRGEGKSAEKQIEQLDKDLLTLRRMNANIVFLGHHIMARRIRERAFPGIFIPPPNANTNEILSISDVLITDYSSIFFDFLVTGRPIIHYMYDYNTYKKARGLALEPDELPGEVAFDAVSLAALTRSAISGNISQSTRYRAAQARFCPHEDGHASARAARWFFENDSIPHEIPIGQDKPRVAFWGGRLARSEALEPFLNQLRERALARHEYITLVIARSAIKSPGVKTVLQELGTAIAVVARDDYEMGMTSAEQSARLRSAKERSREDTDLYDEIYKREYSRLLGNARFDEVVLYGNLSHFWKKLGRLALAA
ncbi:CDP-glycerol glycerophosphotransferase family protein [Brevibacterium salitolerans]|uniref:CDP-glycerol glycerophosphotransferase family protein n=1 Tax=Brevibacterium salitolerans TaxID=1403566 RepID=A0ABN2X8H2_9MICO